MEPGRGLGGGPLVLFVVAAITIFFLRRRPLEVGDHPVPRWLNNATTLLSS